MIVFKSLLIKLCDDETFPQHLPVCDVMNSPVWGTDRTAWLTGGWHVQCSWDGTKTSVLTLWPPSLSQLSLQRQTPYIIFYFWLTRRWTDGGIAKDGRGWWKERGKASSFALAQEDGRMEGSTVKLGERVGEQRKASGLVSRCAHVGVWKQEVRRQRKGGRRGWQEDSWPWMQTDRQGNQRQAVTFSAAGGSKALFKGLVNAWCCWGISLAARRLITTVIQLFKPKPPPLPKRTHTHRTGHSLDTWGSAQCSREAGQRKLQHQHQLILLRADSILYFPHVLSIVRRIVGFCCIWYAPPSSASLEMFH